MGLIYMLNASPTAIDFDVYRQRKPQDSAYYRCVEDCFETLEQVYQERFEQKYGNLGPGNLSAVGGLSEHLSHRNV
jgi:hypothetical protein